MLTGILLINMSSMPIVANVVFFIVVEALHALLGGGFTCIVGKANHQRLIS